MLTSPLLTAKFQAPLLRPDRVPRNQLVEKVDRGYQAGSRLTLICAPAGYGKTTLAVEWLQGQSRFAWCSLDASDNDPARFFTCLVTALQAIAPEFGLRTLNLLSVPQLPPVEHLTQELISEISEVTEPIVLALDDYHHIHLAAIHDTLEFLLNYAPTNLHLLITTREDPAFPLSRLRASGQLTDIRAKDLRFNSEEIHSFLTRVHHLELPEPSIEKLGKITEGWAAGLQLAGLAIQSEEDAEHFFDTFSGAHHYIIAYLLDEVLHRQPEAVQRFLTTTAILDRFNADLCAAVVSDAQISDYHALLAELDRSNLFLTPLDASHTWYRYHRLFADVLRAELEPQHEAELHLRAARWFEANHFPAEAIPHYLAAGATQPAGQIIMRLADERVRHGALQTLLSWTSALPAEEVRAEPMLLAYQILALVMTGNLAEAHRLLSDSAEILQDPAKGGALRGIQAWLRLVSGDHAGLQALAEQALATVSPDAAVFRVLALLVLGDCYFNQNNIAASNEAYQEAYRVGLRTQHPFAALGGLENLVFNLFDQGQMRRARMLCQEAQDRFTDARGNPLPVLGMIDVPLSVFYFEQRDLAQAEMYARRGQALCQKLFSAAMEGGDAETVLARAAYLQGRREEAFRILAEMRQFAIAHRVTAVEDKMNITESDLHLSGGDTEAARACLERLEVHAHGLVPVVIFSRQVHLAEIHILEGQPEAALDLLAPYESMTRREGSMRRLIRLLGLKASALCQLGHKAEAIEVMEEVVRLAAPEGYLSSVLRAPQLATALLPDVHSAAPEFVDQALALLISQPGAIHPAPLATPGPDMQPVPSSTSTLMEPLSEQEQKVLRLLAAGCANQEIAEALVISVGTAKWHVHNILGKLGVSSRSQAAAKARELGLA